MKSKTTAAGVRAFLAISLLFFAANSFSQGLTGPTDVEAGETHTYTYTDDVVFADPNWVVTLGSVTNTWQSGINYNADVFFNSGVGTATVTFRDGSTVLGTMNVNVTASAPPTPTATFTITYNCGNTVVSHVGPPPGANYDWWWQTSSTGTSTSLGYANNFTQPSTGSLWLRARLKNLPHTWSNSSQSVGTVTVYTTAPAVPTSSTPASRFGTGSITVSVGTVSGALSYVWYTQSSGGTAISGQTTNSYAISSLATTTTYYVASKNGCESTGRKDVTATILPLPTVTTTGTNGNSLTMGQQVVLATTTAYTTYTWKNSAGTMVGSAATYSTSTADNYTVTVTQTGVTGTGTSALFAVVSGLTGLNMNYIVSNTVLADNITDPNAIAALTVDNNTQTIQYFDGLGRPIESVTTQGSPLKKDFVQPLVYDGFSREHRKYLPFVPNLSNGWFKASVLDAGGNYVGSATNFYNNSSDKIADDSKPYAETKFEASPMNRVLKQGAPGAVWHPDAVPDKSIEQVYGINIATEVLQWTYTPPNASYPFGLVNAGTAASPTYYPANELTANKSLDEDDNASIEYVDKLGKTVLKKVQSGASQYASTYYIYDDLGQLVCVIPPQATFLITQTSPASEYFDKNDIEKDSFLRHWAFRYRYDNRRRMTHKQVPGTDSVLMIYDKRDRLVLTQDGNQRTPKQWLFTKYDALNRPVITGIYTHGTVIDQAAMSALISTSNFFETYNGVSSTHGYTNIVFPITGTTVLTATYYDDYSFKTMASGLNYVTTDLTGQASVEFKRVKGQVTGSKVNTLGSANYLYSVTYYDDKYRVIQTIAQNHKSGTDRMTNLYDFPGRVLQTRRTYLVSGTTRYVKETFTYDHAGRVLTVKHNTNGAGDIMIVKNDYNELGQSVDKLQHSVDNGTTFKQSVDYRYNIRGWLTKINESDVSSLAGGEMLGDYFGMELAYNNTLSNITATQTYNGNISAIKWSTGALGGASLQGYHYNYDALNRLTGSGHYKTGSAGWVNDNSNLETGFSYDLNGNIQALQRRGAGSAQMDNLTYTYTGNQLNYVNDSWDATTGFVNGNTGNDDYLYDLNGNMTQDKNKGVTAITYNYLNLPVQVNKGATDYIVYTYDATGKKLTQQVFGSTPKTTDYIGEFVFEGATPALKIINHSEGRILPDGANWEYHYHLKDHLGNVRVTFTAKAQTAVTSTADFETSTNSAFQNYNRIGYDLVDHTDAGTTKIYVQKLFNSGRVGVAKSIAVMPGDKVSINAWGKYMNLTTTGNPNLFITSLAAAYGVSSGSTGEQLKIYNGLNNYSGTVPGGNHPDDDETPPKAFVTIILFDKNYNLLEAGWDQMTTVGLQSSPSVKEPPHDQLYREVTATEPGYAYVFISNEHPNNVDVFFDDVTVIHTPSQIVSSSDYFAFGLQFGNGERTGSWEQKTLFQGQEFQDELGLGWFQFKWRNHDPSIGRFFNVDPLSEKYYYNSPYAFSENRVIDGRELEGLEWVNSTGEMVYDPMANDGKGGYTKNATNNEIALGNSLRQTITGEGQFKKLTSLNQKTTVALNEGPAVYDDIGLVLGKARNVEGKTEFDLSKKPSQKKVDVKESIITINLGSVDDLINAVKAGAEGYLGDETNETITKSMSFIDVLGLVLGHEVEHTTDENATLNANGKDIEGPAYKVSDQMVRELKEKQKQNEK